MFYSRNFIAKAKNQIDSNSLNRLVRVDKEIHQVIRLIRNYLYLPEELINLENTLFLDYILYPYLVYHYSTVPNKSQIVSKAVDALRGLMPGAADRITTDGYAGVGRFLVDSLNEKFEVMIQGDFYNEDISIKTQLFIHNPNSTYSAEFKTRFEESNLLAEYIGIGYESFIARSVKFQNDNGYNVFWADMKLNTIEEDIRSGYMSSILPMIMNNNKKNNVYLVDDNPVKDMIAVLEVVEKEFILCNCIEERNKTRMYLNILNDVLHR